MAVAVAVAVAVSGGGAVAVAVAGLTKRFFNHPKRFLKVRPTAEEIVKNQRAKSKMFVLEKVPRQTQINQTD